MRRVVPSELTDDREGGLGTRRDRVGPNRNTLWALLSALTVLLATLLLDGRVGTALAAVHALVLVVVAGLQPVVAVLPLAGDASRPTSVGGALAPALALGLIARACWLYTHDVLRSVDELLSQRSSASPLVQLRTRELTVREVEVVQLVAEGFSNDAIASKLFLSPRTVQSHVANAVRKSGSANRTELGVLAVREGLVPLELVDTNEGLPVA